MAIDLELLKYPVGEFELPNSITDQQFNRFTHTISAFPHNMRIEIYRLTDEDLDTKYRPNGWTVRQVVHHCADSHMNGLIRLKLALTENNPIIKPYDQDAWASLEDCIHYPIAASLSILDGVHERWSTLLKSLTPKERHRTFVHPEHGTVFTIDQHTANYDWHCRHHLAHITAVRMNRKK